MESWPAVDLWALGSLIRWVWTELGGEESVPLPGPLASLADVLCAVDPEERESTSALEVADVARRLIQEQFGPTQEDDPDDGQDPARFVLEPGACLGGRYEILEVLGRGATGIVLSVQDLLAQKRFALKVFRDGVEIEIALREFGSLTEIAHPNVVRVYDILLEQGHVCLKMEKLKKLKSHSHLIHYF